MTRVTKADGTARDLITTNAVQRPPVPVERIAKHAGARIAYEPFDGNISGMLYRVAGAADSIIGVNSRHPITRQRFTVAHELGHLLLHRGRDVILDRIVRVNYRDHRSSSATDREEVEANQFAAALLMPEEWLRAEIETRSFGAIDVDEIVASLAERFKVSVQAMDFRLTNLGIRQHL